MQSKKRFLLMLLALLMCLLSGLAVFALLITALSATGAGNLAVPGAFVCLAMFELARYWFYRSFYRQQLARFAAWKFDNLKG